MITCGASGLGCGEWRELWLARELNSFEAAADPEDSAEHVRELAAWVRSPHTAAPAKAVQRSVLSCKTGDGSGGLG